MYTPPSYTQAAVQAAPAVLVPQILFAGFFVKISSIPVWIRWAQYLCSLKFAINLHMINEFGNNPYGGCDPKLRPDCDNLLERTEVYPDMWWAYVLILLAIFTGFRMMGLFVLTKKANGTSLA